MYDLAHVCQSCRTMTIFSKEAAYPRRCGCCDAVLRPSPSGSAFVARPVWDDDDEVDETFALELGPAAVTSAPF
ncbi:MAG: hypothetical protein HYV09_20105 [Deltaproteobacteria bacterium]|nr:hypothetical protein [Deltaproteobacteria bacterium]